MLPVHQQAVKDMCFQYPITIEELTNKMKVLSSLKSAKKRDLNCKLIKRKGKLYVINKKNPKFKAKQG